MLRDVAQRLPLVWPVHPRAARQHRALRLRVADRGARDRPPPAAGLSRDARADGRRARRADRFRRHAGRDDGARRAVPDDAREHRAADHGRAGHQHDRRPRPSRDPRRASTRSSPAGGKRGRVPELWDGHAAERIAAISQAWLASRARRGTALEARGGMTSAATLPAMPAAAATDGADHQRADDRRRGLLPGLGVRAVHRSRATGTRCECRVERNVERILALLADAGVDGHLLHARLDRRALSAAACGAIVDAGHELASHGYGHQRASEQSAAKHFAPTSGAPRRCSRTSPAREVRGYRAPSFSIGRANLWAFDCLARGGLPLQLEHLPDPPRPLRHARCAALRARRAARAARGAGHDGARAARATGRRAAAATSGCCRMRCRAGRSGASTRATASRRCSISIRGRSTPTSRACRDRMRRRAFATTSTCERMEPRLRACCATSAGTASIASSSVRRGVMGAMA